MGWFKNLFLVEDPPSPTIDAKGVEFSAEAIETIRNLGSPVWSSYASMYRKQPAVRSVVDFLSRNIAQLNPKCYERLGNTDRLEIGEHPLAELLRHPNPDATRFRHLRDTVADIAVFDVAYWEKYGDGLGTQVVRLSPASMLVDIWKGRTRYRFTSVDGVERTIPRDRLVIFPGYTPDGNGLGVSPLETLRQVLQADWAAMHHRSGYWNNAARHGGVIERPVEAPEWSDDARRVFRADLEAMYSGRQNSGRTMVLEEGMTWNSTSFSPKDSEYIDGRKLTYEEVAVAYFGPVVGRSFLEATGAGTESNHRQLYQDVFGPWLRMLQDEIELQVLPIYEPLGAAARGRGQRIYIEFDLAAKLAGSFEEQSKSLVSSIGVPYLTINEGRARLNAPRIDAEWADTPVQPLNVMYGGQPAVTVPTQVPGDVPGIASVRPEVKAAAETHAEVLRHTFERQRGSITNTTKADRSIDWGRWDRELAADLFVLAVAVTKDVGERVARELGGAFDEKRTYAWLAEHTRSAAEQINATTAAELDAADIEVVFEQAKTGRADRFGTSWAASLTDWARNEAVRQNPNGTN